MKQNSTRNVLPCFVSGTKVWKKRKLGDAKLLMHKKNKQSSVSSAPGDNNCLQFLRLCGWTPVADAPGVGLLVQRLGSEVW